MTLIIRDILYGNPRLDEMGWHEEALGRNAVVGGFQGQRQWTDWLPNADFTEAIMASTFDWNGPKAPTPFATENDTCNGIAMMLGSLVSGSAPCFHDVRTYWSPEACERVTGQKPDGVAANGRRDSPGWFRCLCGCQGQSCDETVLGDERCGHQGVPERHRLVPCGL